MIQGIAGRTIKRKLLYDEYAGGFFGELSATGVTYRVEPPGIVEVEHLPEGHMTQIRCLAPGTAQFFASVDYGGTVSEKGPVTVTVEGGAPAKLGPVLIDRE